MALIGSLEFRVSENNGGGIALAIKEKNQFIYIHSGYETSRKGQLIEDVKALFDGDHPSVWDGNELEDFTSILQNDEGLDDDDICDRLDREYWWAENDVRISMVHGIRESKRCIKLYIINE